VSPHSDPLSFETSKCNGVAWEYGSKVLDSIPSPAKGNQTKKLDGSFIGAVSYAKSTNV
jgi:hypothetical protein